MRAILFLALALFAFLPLSAWSQQAIWVALVKADNEKVASDPQLDPWFKGLKSVFGFESYHLLYETEVPLGQKYAQWVLPRKDFYLKLEPTERPGGPLQVLFELYRDKTCLVNGNYTPKGKRPLFIGGPDYQKGKLLFILKETHSSGITPPSANP